MTTSAEKAEQDVEQSRERLTRTLDHIQSQFSQLSPKTQLGNYGLQPRQLNEAAQNIISVMRRAPLPTLMIGAGVCWLIYETFTQSSRRNTVSTSARSMLTAGSADAHIPTAVAVRDDERLEKALHETMAGSDPVAVRITR